MQDREQENKNIMKQWLAAIKDDQQAEETKPQKEKEKEEQKGEIRMKQNNVEQYIAETKRTKTNTTTYNKQHITPKKQMVTQEKKTTKKKKRKNVAFDLTKSQQMDERTGLEKKEEEKPFSLMDKIREKIETYNRIEKEEEERNIIRTPPDEAISSPSFVKQTSPLFKSLISTNKQYNFGSTTTNNNIKNTSFKNKDKYEYESPLKMQSKTASPNGERTMKTLLATDPRTLEMLTELEAEKNKIQFRKKWTQEQPEIGTRTAPENSGRIWKSAKETASDDDEEEDIDLSDDEDIEALLKAADQMNEQTNTLASQLGIKDEQRRKRTNRKQQQIQKKKTTDLVVTPITNENITKITNGGLKGGKKIKKINKPKIKLTDSTDFTSASFVPQEERRKPKRTKKRPLSSTTPSSTKSTSTTKSSSSKSSTSRKTSTKTSKTRKKTTTTSDLIVTPTTTIKTTQYIPQKSMKGIIPKTSPTAKNTDTTKTPDSKDTDTKTDTINDQIGIVSLTFPQEEQTPNRKTTITTTTTRKKKKTTPTKKRRSHLPQETEFSKTIKEKHVKDTQRINSIIKNHMKTGNTPTRPLYKPSMYRLNQTEQNDTSNQNNRQEEQLADALESKLQELQQKLVAERNERFQLKEQLDNIKLEEQRDALNTAIRAKNLEKKKLQERQLDIFCKRKNLATQRHFLIKWKKKALQQQGILLQKAREFRYKAEWKQKLAIFRAWLTIIKNKRQAQYEKRIQVRLQTQRRLEEMADKFRKIQLVSKWLLHWHVATKMIRQKRKVRAKSALYKRKMNNLLDRLESGFEVPSPSSAKERSAPKETAASPRSPHSRSPPKQFRKASSTLVKTPSKVASSTTTTNNNNEKNTTPRQSSSNSKTTTKDELKVRHQSSAEPRFSSKTRQQRAFVSKMEKRAKEREAKRAELKAQYAAIREKEAREKEEAARAEEEAARAAKREAIREKRAAAAAEKARQEARVAEQKRFKILKARAKAHYRQTLLRKYIIGGLRRYREHCQTQIETMKQKSNAILCGHVLKYLRRLLAERQASRKEAAREHFHQLLAQHFIISPYFNAWFEHTEKQQAKCQQIMKLCHLHLKRRLLREWKENFEKTRELRLKHEAYVAEQSKQLSRRFQLRNYMLRWIQYTSKTKKAKQRQNDEAQLTKEVDGWLKNYRMTHQFDEVWNM